ncbi:MAG: tetratricopeptide repeat protein [Acidobacteria bacterium]|nr:tetratricopeptide repeat protein [Acidobacteriota bacterium]
MASDIPTKYKSARPVYDDPLWNLYDSIYLKLEPRRKEITYGVSLFIGLILVGSLAYGIMSSRTAQAQAAFGLALEVYKAEVVKPGSEEAKAISPGKKTFADEKEKYKQAATQFDKVATDYSTYREVANYYAAMSRTYYDPAKAQTDLEAISKNNSEVALWAKIGLAELYAATGQTDKAITAYQALKDNSGSLPKSVVLYTLGRLYERQGNNAEAINVYTEAAKANRSSTEGRKAYERLSALDPAAAEKLPPEETKKDDDI